MGEFTEPLKTASKDLQAAGMYFMQEGMKNPNNALAGSNDFMHLFGHVCLGLMWARMAKAALVQQKPPAPPILISTTRNSPPRAITWPGSCR